jgi:hypothetical protein
VPIIASQSPLRSSGNGCCSICGLLGVDKILDGSDLDAISRRAKRENEDGLVGERSAAGAFTEQLRLEKNTCHARGQ